MEEVSMARAKDYVLVPQVFAHLSSRFGDKFICFRCGKGFKLGDKVHAIGRRKFYHKACFDVSVN